ncbi:MAG: Rpn family recombination-promoting nuclease/putative transposase [Polyangiaceae bacterium]|nr:Rpn family recombination-promoting nuclease/putative transposase [Polyangiaceae bacterium]
MTDPDSKVFPHDALVRRIFSAPENAAAQFRATLPEGLLANLDLSTLSVEESSFVSQELRGTVVDMLYSAKYRGRPAYLYVLFEHMSTVDPLMPLRTLGSALQVWERHTEKARSEGAPLLPLPLVLVQVLHHSERGWTAATRFEGLFDPEGLQDPEVRAATPHWGFLLDDVSRASDEDLRQRELGPMLTVALALLRDSRRGARLLRTIAAYTKEFEAILKRSGGREAFLVFVLYVWTVTQGTVGQDALEALKAVSGAGEAVMTFAEELEARGEARGKAEGVRLVLLSQLEAKFGSITDTVRERVSGAGVADCLRWSARLLEARSAGEVFGD